MKADLIALIFDLQKSYMIPVLTTNKVCYKPQLVLYNEGIHNMAANQGYTHLWTENVGKGGSREIALVVHHFVRRHWQGRKRLSFWWDHCWGQNKHQFRSMG